MNDIDAMNVTDKQTNTLTDSSETNIDTYMTFKGAPRENLFLIYIM